MSPILRHPFLPHDVDVAFGCGAGSLAAEDGTTGDRRAAGRRARWRRGPRRPGGAGARVTALSAQPTDGARWSSALSASRRAVLLASVSASCLVLLPTAALAQDVISIVNGTTQLNQGVILDTDRRLELTNAGTLWQSRFNVTSASISNSGIISGMALWTTPASSNPGNFTIDNSGTITSYIVSSNRVGSIIITDCTRLTSGGGDCIGDAISSVQQGAIGTGQAGPGPVSGGFADGSLIINRATGLIRDGIRHEGGTSNGGVTVINDGTIQGANTFASSTSTVLPPVDLARGAFTNNGRVLAHGARNYRNPAIAIYDVTGPILNYGLIDSGPNLSGSDAHIASTAGGIWAAGVSPVVRNFAGLNPTQAGQMPAERVWNTTSGIRGTHAALHLTVAASGNPIRSVGTIENAVDGYLSTTLAFNSGLQDRVIFDRSFAAHHTVSVNLGDGTAVTVNNAGVIERPDGFFAAIMVGGRSTTPAVSRTMEATITNQAGARIGHAQGVTTTAQQTGTGIRVEAISVYLENLGTIRASNYGVGFANTPTGAFATGVSADDGATYLQFMLRSGSLIETTLGPGIGIKGATETFLNTSRTQSLAPIAVESLVTNDNRQSNAVLASQRVVLSGNSVIEENAVVSGGGIHLTSLMGYTVTNRGTIRSVGTGTPDLFGLHTGFFETGVQHRNTTNNITLVGGALINEATGTISSERNAAVRMAAGTLINHGIITSTNIALSSATVVAPSNGPTITNTSPVLRTVLPSGSETAGVFAQQLNRFENVAQITGENYGVWIGVSPSTATAADGTPGLSGTFLNTGTIRATRSNGFDGVRIGNVSGNAVVRNTGTIEGARFSNQAGVRFDADSTITPIFENSGDGVTTGIVTGSRGVDFRGDAIIRGVGTDINGNPNRLTGRIEGLRPASNSNGDNGIRVAGRLMADFNTTALIRSAGNGAAVHVGNGNGQTIRNDGTMRGGNAGLRVVAGTATVLNESSGIIDSADPGTNAWSANVVGMDLTGISTLINEGLVTGTATGRAGLVMTGTNPAGSGTIVNQGTGIIRSDATGAGAAILATGSNNIAVLNSARIEGSITLAGGNDLINNSRTITGAVDLGAGDDTYVLAQGATQGGAIVGGAGTGDLFQFEISAGSTRHFNATGGTGNQVITQFETIRQTGAGLLISLGTLDSAVTLIDVQGGTFRNEGTIAAATDRSLLLSGDRTIFENVAGASIAAPIIATDGLLRQSVFNNGTITGSISLGGGDDVVSNRGLITGDVDLGTGNDSFVWWLTGVAIGPSGTITAGAGIDSLLLGVDAGESVTLTNQGQLSPANAPTGFEAVGKAGDGELIWQFPDALTTEGLRVLGGRLVVQSPVNADLTANAGSGFVQIDSAGSVLDNQSILTAGDRLEMRADRTTLINSGTITVNGTGRITGGDGAQVIENSGRIAAAVNLGGGADLYTLMETGTQIGAVDGGDGNDIFRFDVTGQRSFASGDVLNFETIRQTGTGLLTFSSGTLSTATTLLDVQGGTFANQGTLTATTTLGLNASTTLRNSGAIDGLVVGSGPAIRVENSGTITGALTLTGGGNVYILAASGTQIGQASGGDSAPATRNSLQIETAADTTRTLAASRFVHFQQIDLNLDTLSTGRLTLLGAADPAAAASLDTGGGVGSSITLHRGHLALTEANSSLRAATVTLAEGTRLSGIGTVFNGTGGTTLASGTLAPGNSPGTLTIDGNLTLAATSRLEFQLGEAGAGAPIPGGTLNDLIVVNGNLVLDGRVSVTQSTGGTFGPGIYRLITVSGTTTNNTLEIDGNLPNGHSGSIQVLANQVNLIVPAGGGGPPGVGVVGPTGNYWDGPNLTPNSIVDGGAGTWSEAGTNWTTETGAAQGRWGGTFAIFQTTGGTVTVAEGYRPVFRQLQFNVGGYRIEGSTLGIESAAEISVTGAFDTTIASLINGAGSLNKRDDGRLILTGANSYEGGTTISEGTLAVGHDTALGTGAVTLRNGTTLQAFGADRTLVNAVTLAGSAGTFDTQAFRLTLTGDLSVQDTLRKLGSGTLALTLANPAAPVPVVSFRDIDLAAGTLENHRSLNLSNGVAMGDGTTLDNRLGATIATSTAGIRGGDGVQTVINAGTINAPVSLGGGNDRYELQNFAVQTGRVDGGAGTDTAAFRVDTGNTITIVGDQFFNFELLEKSGGGTLQLIPGTDSLATATVRILGGQVINETRVNVSNRVELGTSGITWTNTPGGSVTATASDPVAIRATAAQVTVANAGAISGEVRLTGGGNTYVLTTIGTQAGLVHAGDAATNNRLQVNASASGRTLEPASFVNFGRIDLNLIDAADPSTARGRITLVGQGSAAASLDAGTAGQVTLHHGELNLQNSTSTVRAGRTEIGAPASLSGNGEVLGALTVLGTIAPGNSIGMLTVTGNYAQPGRYEVEFRPPPIGLARGRHMLTGGGAASLAEQDADLIHVQGNATLTGGIIVPVRRGTAAQMNAALAAQGPGGSLRWLVLRAQTGLGGTRFVVPGNLAGVRVVYPDNGTDVELVLDSPINGGGDPPPPDDPKPRQWGLSQSGVLFDLAADCDRPIGLSSTTRDESWCSFGQGRLLTASGEGRDGLSVYGGAWAQSGLGRSRLRVADAATGVMRRVGDEAWLGFAVGYGLGWSDFGGAGGEAYKTSFNALQLAALGRWAFGPLELRGMLGYGWSEVEGRRPSRLGGEDQRLVAKYDLQQATVAGEARWWFGTRGDLALAPTLRLTGARQWRSGYSEEGTSADRFTAQRATWDSLRMLLGVTGEIGTSLYGTPLVVEPRLGWVRELGDRAVTVTGSYAGTPDEVTTARGVPALRDSAVMGLAGIAQLTDNTRLRLGYDGSWYDGGSSHSLTMRLSYAW